VASPRTPTLGRWLRCLAAGTWLAQALGAGAAPLADPTRPPSVQTSGAATPSAGRGTLRPLAPVPPPPPPPPLPALPALQSVHLPAQGSALALVDGQQVRIGDTLAGRRVLTIDNQGLTLQGRDGHERLLLLAGASKQAAGSIQTQRSAGFSATPGAAGGAGEAETETGTEAVARHGRIAKADQAPVLQSRPANTGPLSLAGKTSP